MAIPTSLVGAGSGPLVHDVDARWTMAYAAALGDDLARYMDTRRADPVVAHPLFAVCPEWPVIVSSRHELEAMGVAGDDVARGVHATHDLTVHRLVRAGDRLSTSMVVTGVERRSPGAFVTMVLETLDADGAPVATTRQGTLYLGVDCSGSDAPAPDDQAALPAPTVTSRAEYPVEIGPEAAHTYTECARIWNPIHTDVEVAQRAGLPDLILHGTATLAHAVSTIVREMAGGDPGAVRRVVGRFGAMVLMPSTIVVELHGDVPTADGGTAVHFEVLADGGGAAVDRGVVVLR